MSEKEPVLLLILVDSKQLSWHVAGIGMNQSVYPLLASQPADLDSYIGKSDDEQASFLRHRFCGILQRGCDRLWGLKKKAGELVIQLDGVFPEADPQLTRRVADHLVGWMTNPPLSVLMDGPDSTDDNHVYAGEISPEHQRLISSARHSVLELTAVTSSWESVPRTPA